jgi:hypothetical protein
MSVLVVVMVVVEEEEEEEQQMRMEKNYPTSFKYDFRIDRELNCGRNRMIFPLPPRHKTCKCYCTNCFNNNSRLPMILMTVKMKKRN